MAITKIIADSITSGAVANTPAFRATIGSTQVIAHNTQTKAQFNTEDFDTDSCYDTGTYRFTPNVAGKYFFGLAVRFDTATDIDITSTIFYKNGSGIYIGEFSNIRYNNWFNGTIITMNGSSDYVEAFVYQGSGVSVDLRTDSNQFFAYKIIE